MEEQQSGFIDPQLALAALTAAIKVPSHFAVKDLTQYHGDNPDPVSPLVKGVGINKQDANMAKLGKAFDELTGKDFNTAQRVKAHSLSPESKHFPGVTYSRHNDVRNQREFNIGYSLGTDSAAYAHELGHALAQSGDFGASVNDIRHQLANMPQLQKALSNAMNTLPEGTAKTLAPYMDARRLMAGSKYLLPAAIAAAIPGDNDVAATLAANIALASPTLLDEALATNRGLAIMEKAGMPATPRQRMRLAGAWGSYLAGPLVASLVGNVAGNAVDADV